MKNADSQMDVNEAFATLDKTMAELRQGFQPEKLNSEQRQGILFELDKLEVEALKCKIKMEVRSLADGGPTILYKEFLVKILQTLPATLPASSVNELMEYTANLWFEVAAPAEA